jgi:hypothetical protein
LLGRKDLAEVFKVILRHWRLARNHGSTSVHASGGSRLERNWRTMQNG